MRQHHPFLWASIVSFATLASGACSTSSTAPERTTQPDAMTVFSPGIKNVAFEIDYVPGAEPYLDSSHPKAPAPFTLFQANVQALFHGTSKNVIIPTALAGMEALTDVTGGDFTEEQIKAIAEKHRGTPNTSDTASYYLLWLNGYYLSLIHISEPTRPY